MITTKIKALFTFIEYLHSNIENFNQHNDLIKELEALADERRDLRPESNYKDRLQYDKVQAVIKSKFEVLQKHTANPIKAKAIELNVCSFENEPNYSFNGIESDIHQFKKQFSNEDLPEIFKHKSQYIEYRTKTHKTFLSLQMFFEDLDEVTKSLFDYFKDTAQNEFEAFETKTIQVNSFGEAIELFTKGQTKFTLTNNLFEVQDKTNDFEALKKYIRENYLNVHPNKFTLERLEQIKRNISTWKLQLKDLNEAPELQEFISEVIADINLKIGRFGTEKNEPEPKFSYIEKEERETVQTEFSETIKKKLEPLRQAFNNDTDFQKAITAIQNFFLGKGNPEQPIFVKNGNTRNLAFALGEIWKCYKNNVITYDYFHFYRQTFSIFNKEKYNIDEAESIFSHLLYKYSISKT